MTMSDTAEISTKPYFIRALYEWCTDNGYTPHISVVVDRHARVPMEFVRNGEIVLNVSALATNQLAIQNDYIEFQARFGGVARDVYVPMANISAIYARETGHGMAFNIDLNSETSDDQGNATASTTAQVMAEDKPSASPILGLASSGSVKVSDEPTPPDSTGGAGGGKKPKLTVIK